MVTAFDFCDDLGPEKIIHLHDPTGSGLRAIVVVDNVAAGPAIGGTRMAADVSLQECFRLARAMTLKNAAAGLPHGGAKSVIFADPGMPADQKQQLVRAFAYAIRDVLDYIPGPDMGTDETCMAWVRDTIGRAVGLPRAIGGIPLDEIGATGYGLATALDVAQEPCGFTLRGARVVVQGFGSVGKHAARFLAERGAVLVGASDTSGTLHHPDGIDVAALIAFKDAGNGVADFPGGTRQPGDAVIDIPCEIWIPAARPDVIHAGNVHRLQTRVIAQGANIPFTPEAEATLHRQGVWVLPDFIANAGGVICASVEYHGGSEGQARQVIAEKIAFNTRAVLESALRSGCQPREAAVRLAGDRVRSAMALRRCH